MKKKLIVPEFFIMIIFLIGSLAVLFIYTTGSHGETGHYRPNTEINLAVDEPPSTGGEPCIFR